ncbi:MAG: DUF2891 family protein [Longimicrobiales bacterium]
MILFRTGFLVATVCLLACSGPDSPDHNGPGTTGLGSGDTASGGEQAGLEGTVSEVLGSEINAGPDSGVWRFDEQTALTLAALPLACLDRPHARRKTRVDYLDDITYTRRADFQDNLAFYGCWDWHSAVNSTWAVVRILKEFPDLAIGPLLREKLRSHLSEESLAGELVFLQENPLFERPYGWAWLLKLHGELASWREPEAAVWAGRLDPLVRLITSRMADHIAELERPVRSGVHPNTAFAIATTLEATQQTSSLRLDRMLRTSARRLFEPDQDCPTAYEPGNSDFLSPCLEEAALMAMVMPPEEFVAWLDGFLPPLESPAFAPLRTAAPYAEDGPALPGSGFALSDDSVRAMLGARSHLIGLAFTRADAMVRISGALPADDLRSEAFLELANQHASDGFEAMFDADYAGSHWIGTFALKYLAISSEAGP